jgi:hypothetical protein
MIEGRPGLLVGKGDVPKVWLSARLDGQNQGWGYVIKMNLQNTQRLTLQQAKNLGR